MNAYAIYMIDNPKSKQFTLYYNHVHKFNKYITVQKYRYKMHTGKYQQCKINNNYNHDRKL